MDESLKERVRVAVSCKDSEYIPKVSGAGTVTTDAASGREVQVMHNGLKVYVDSHYGDFNTEVIQKLRGHHEPQEEKVFFEVLKKIPGGGVMLELGSFWAYYSMWFNRAVPEARNYMVEPMPEVLRHGKDNFRLNGLTGDFTQACVGRESKDAVSFQHWDGTLYQRAQVAVDDFLRRKGIGYLDILHADIQGAEHEMLLGAQDSLANGRIGFVFVSTHSEELHQQCLELLCQARYRVIAEHSLWESYAVDGLIAVAHPDKEFPPIRVSKRRILFRVRSRVGRLLRRLKRPAAVERCPCFP